MDRSDVVGDELVGLLKAAEPLLVGVFDCNRRMGDPDEFPESWHSADLLDAFEAIENHILKVGRLAVERLVPAGANPLVDIEWSVGRVLVEGHHATLVRNNQRALDAWRQWDWDALLEQGQLDPDQHRYYREWYSAGLLSLHKKSPPLVADKQWADWLLIGSAYLSWASRPAGRQQWMEAVREAETGPAAELLPWEAVHGEVSRMEKSEFARFEATAAQTATVFSGAFKVLPERRLDSLLRLVEVSAFAHRMAGPLPADGLALRDRLVTAAHHVPDRNRVLWLAGIHRLSDLSTPAVECLREVSSHAAQAYTQWFDQLNRETAGPDRW